MRCKCFILRLQSKDTDAVHSRCMKDHIDFRGTLNRNYARRKSRKTLILFIYLNLCCLTGNGPKWISSIEEHNSTCLCPWRHNCMWLQCNLSTCLAQCFFYVCGSTKSFHPGTCSNFTCGFLFVSGQ